MCCGHLWSRSWHLPPVPRVCCVPLWLGQGGDLSCNAVETEPFSLHLLLIFLILLALVEEPNPLCRAPFGRLAPGQRGCGNLPEVGSWSQGPGLCKPGQPGLPVCSWVLFHLPRDLPRHLTLQFAPNPPSIFQLPLRMATPAAAVRMLLDPKHPVLGAWQPVSIPQPGSYAQVPLPLCFQPRDALGHRGTAPEGLLWPRLEQPRAFVAGLLWFPLRTSKNEALSVVPLCCFPSLWSLFLCTLLWLCAGLGHGPESISSPAAVQRPQGRAASSPVPRAPEQTRSMSPPESGGVG